jgi:nucleotide-binding universal stress UspA family protein
VYVGDEQAADSVLSEASARLKVAGVEHTAVNLQKGKSDELLCRYQDENNIDLTVMGAYSHHPLRDMLLGSFTAKMLHKNRQPLLLLR